MKTIELTQGYVALVDDDDFEELNKLNWFYHKGSNAKTGYAWSYVKKTQPAKYLVMHRLIMKAEKGQIIDHIDRNGLNNQKVNLRFCTQSENMHNTELQSNNTHGVKGVYFNNKKYPNNPWYSKITVDNKTYNLGYYPTKEEAALAYNKAALTYRKDFTNLNKI